MNIIARVANWFYDIWDPLCCPWCERPLKTGNHWYCEYLERELKRWERRRGGH